MNDSSCFKRAIQMCCAVELQLYWERSTHNGVFRIDQILSFRMQGKLTKIQILDEQRHEPQVRHAQPNNEEHVQPSREVVVGAALSVKRLVQHLLHHTREMRETKVGGHCKCGPGLPKPLLLVPANHARECYTYLSPPWVVSWRMLYQNLDQNTLTLHCFFFGERSLFSYLSLLIHST
jgi:hypothetical protein